MKLGIQLFLLVATVKSQFTVTMRLCTARDSTPKIVNQAWGKYRGLQMQIDDNEAFELTQPINMKNEDDMTARFNGDIDAASTVSFLYTDNDILCIEKLEIRSLKSDAKFNIIQDYDPYAWDPNVEQQGWTSLTGKNSHQNMILINLQGKRSHTGQDLASQTAAS
jgi:hypothetical protein